MKENLEPRQKLKRVMKINTGKEEINSGQGRMNRFRD